MSSDLHEAVVGRLAAGDNRYTASRRALVEILERAGRPLAVEEIVHKAGDLPRGSVYRNLGVLQESGVVHAIAGNDSFSRYELDEGLMGHHHHLACASCGALTDVELPADLELQLQTAIEKVTRRSGFLPASHRLDVVGTCENCAGG